MIRRFLNWFISTLAVGVCIALALLMGQVEMGLGTDLDMAVKAGVLLLLGVFAFVAIRDTIGEDPGEGETKTNKSRHKARAKRTERGRIPKETVTGRIRNGSTGRSAKSRRNAKTPHR